MYYFIVILSTAIFCLGVTRFLGQSFFSLCRSTISQLDVIIDSSMEEEVKEKLLLKQLKALLGHLFTALFLFILVLVVSVLPVYLFVKFTHTTQVDTQSIYFIVSMIIGSGALFFVPKSSSNYSYWSRLLHTIVLENYSIAQWLFRFQKKCMGKGTKEQNKNFVIVSGLARGGTTALTEMLFRSNSFHSIKYSNMPFLMAPKLWGKVYRPKNKLLKERAHGDKLLVGESSIEALEEHFFKAFLRDSYIGKDSLQVHEIDSTTYQSYLDYQSFYQESVSKTIYLSKNNNFLLRYQSIRKQNTQFKFVMIYRDPLDHAQSLLRQHLNFCRQQKEDPFTLDYMNWLGHYEFGLNQKVFGFAGDKLCEPFEKDNINYWLGIWINYYQFALTLDTDSNLFLVDYSDFLNYPNKLKDRLAQEMNINLGRQKEVLFEKKNKQMSQMRVDNILLEKANAIYRELGVVTD